VELFKAQGKRGTNEERTRIDWQAIALECIPGFAKIRSDGCVANRAQGRRGGFVSV